MVILVFYLLRSGWFGFCPKTVTNLTIDFTGLSSRSLVTGEELIEWGSLPASHSMSEAWHFIGVAITVGEADKSLP